MQQTNHFRKKHERETVDTDNTLQLTARNFASFMARTDRYGHQADGRSSAERAKAHDYPLCLIAENIAYFFATEGFKTEELARQAVDGWIDSPPHRENMLRKHVTETGVGVAQSEQTGVFYAVQLFGRPTSQAIRFQLKNDSGQSITYQLGNHSYSLPPSYTRTHQMCVPYGLTLQTAESKQNSRQLKNGEELIVTMGKDGLRIESRANQE
ncbi:MAG: CAP domain-containing protein [Planctomycetaceae bacterium]